MIRTPGYLVLLVCLTPLVGCTPSALDGTFNSPDPAAKLNAIKTAGINRDATAIPHLIQQLESDDPSVRLFAIGALERITGTRLGYIPYDPPTKRRAAIEGWLRAYHADDYSGSTAAESVKPIDPINEPVTTAAP